MLKCSWIVRTPLTGLALLAVLGCGPGRGDVSGKVTFQDKPLRFGTVSILGGDGIPKSGQIGEGGAYKVLDVQEGSVKVAVTSADPAASQPAQRIPGTPAPKVNREGWFAIPDNYGDFEKSGLTFPMKRGANTFGIELKK